MSNQSLQEAPVCQMSVNKCMPAFTSVGMEECINICMSAGVSGCTDPGMLKYVNMRVRICVEMLVV